MLDSKTLSLELYGYKIYFVEPKFGSNANSGLSREKAFCTRQHALAIRKPEDIIILLTNPVEVIGRIPEGYPRYE